MKETRAGKYGRNLAITVNQILDNLPADQRYKRAFLKELQTYSFEGRKHGMPPGPGCVNELDGIESIDPRNPRHLARLVKEGIHLMYQKQTASRVLYSLLENL